jgi:GTP cyclohydrolase I
MTDNDYQYDLTRFNHKEAAPLQWVDEHGQRVTPPQPVGSANDWRPHEQESLTGFWANYEERFERIEDAVVSILAAMDIDLNDPNFANTPKRVARAFLTEWCLGYVQDPEKLITVFPNNSNEHDLVIVKDIPFYSMCAHHLAPFNGRASVAYVAGDKVLGLSKFARIIQMYARRLTLQEHITQQAAETLVEFLNPAGVMVVLHNVTHTCMCSRGANAIGSSTTTSATRGAFFENPALRAETLSLLLK